MSSVGAEADTWSGTDVSVREIEEALADLRRAELDDDVPVLRTSVMTHLAWVPEECGGSGAESGVRSLRVVPRDLLRDDGAAGRTQCAGDVAAEQPAGADDPGDGHGRGSGG